MWLPSPSLYSQANGCGIVESVMNWVKFKAQTQLNKKCSAVKHTKIKGVPKLDDANDAGTGTIIYIYIYIWASVTFYASLI